LRRPTETFSTLNGFVKVITEVRKIEFLFIISW